MDAPYHHLFEWGNNGIFSAIGMVKKAYTMDSRGDVSARSTVKVTNALDDRISEGIYCARAIDHIRKFVEKPAVLQSTPGLCKELLEELNLKPLDEISESGFK